MVQETLQVAGNSMSPARISFSYDLRCNSDAFPTHLPASPPPAAADFDFCVRRSCDHDSPSAAELFADGKIVPAEIKKKTQKPKSPPPPEILEETTGMSKKQSSDETEEKEKRSSQNGRSFWGFKRSSSVTGYGASRLCPLPLLSRSNSTGSAGGSKGAQKTTSVSGNNIQKPPLKKSYGGSGGGVKVSPVVLHVPVVNIFGRGSIFSGSSNGRDHRNKIANSNNK